MFRKDVTYHTIILKVTKNQSFHPLFKRYNFQKITEVGQNILMRNNWRNWKKEFRIFLLFTQLEVFWYWKCVCVIIKSCERYLTSILDVREFLSSSMSWSLLLPLIILTVSDLQLTAEFVFCLFWYYQNAEKIDHVLCELKI